MTLRLLLVRHGLSSYNKDGRIQGRNDLSTLTEEGKAQALKAGEALANLNINAVYSSPLQRAAQTTELLIHSINKELRPVLTDDLLEVDLDHWSGLTKRQVESQFPEANEIWKEDAKDLEITRKDGTSFKPILELSEQAKTFLDKITISHPPSKEQTILIVAHNAILRCLITELLNDPEKGFNRLQLDNTSISIINIKSKNKGNYKIQLECLNSISHLNPKLPLNKKRSRIILVRHGETDWNRKGKFQGQIDIPLNKNGKKQAEEAGLFLKNILINKAYSSSMSRPKETAKIILGFHKNIIIKEEEKLVEISHGSWEGKLESEINQEWGDLLKTWKEEPDKVQMPGGENIRNVWSRSIEAFERICSELLENETALLVAHDAVNKTILCHLLGLQPADIWKIKQGNGGITIIDITSNPLEPNIVTSLNLTSHLGDIIDKTAVGAL